MARLIPYASEVTVLGRFTHTARSMRRWQTLPTSRVRVIGLSRHDGVVTLLVREVTGWSLVEVEFDMGFHKATAANAWDTFTNEFLRHVMGGPTERMDVLLPKVKQLRVPITTERAKVLLRG